MIKIDSDDWKAIYWIVSFISLVLAVIFGIRYFTIWNAHKYDQSAFIMTEASLNLSYTKQGCNETPVGIFVSKDDNSKICKLSLDISTNEFIGYKQFNLSLTKNLSMVDISMCQMSDQCRNAFTYMPKVLSAEKSLMITSGIFLILMSPWILCLFLTGM